MNMTKGFTPKTSMQLSSYLKAQKVYPLYSFKALWIFSFALLFSSLSFALTSNTGITYTGRIVKPDGTALQEAGVQFLVQVYGDSTLHGDGTAGADHCLLYQETQTLDMSTSNGAFSLVVGQGASPTFGAGVTSLVTVFRNPQTSAPAASEAIGAISCTSGQTSYLSSSWDNNRSLLVTVTTSSATLNLASMPIQAVPFAQQALQVGGYSSDYLMRVQSSRPGSANNFSANQFDFLLNLGINAVTPGTPSTYQATNLLADDPTVNQQVATKHYVDTAIASGSGTVTNVATGTGLSGGPITTTGTISLANTAVTAGSYGDASHVTALTVDAQGRLTAAASTAIALDAAAITSGVLPIARGGTNSGTALNNNRIMASVGGAITELGAMTNGQMVVGVTGAAPAVVSMSGDATLSSAGALTLATVPVSKGGTNITSFTANSIVGTDATGTSLTSFTCPTGNAITFDVTGTAGCTDVSALANAFVQNGNSFGAGAVLGTKDNNTLSFITNNTTAMTIDASGNVGIGTTGPGASLEVNVATGAGKGERIVSPYGGSSSDIYFSAWNAGGTAITDYAKLGYNDGSGILSLTHLAAYPLTFGTNNTERMRVDATGNIGIATTAPVSKLHVGVAPTATANYGLVSLGSGAFDGSTAGYFGTGGSSSANGTVVAINTASGYTGDLVNYEVGGASKFKVDYQGNITYAGTMAISGDTTSTGNISTSGNISTTGTGTITSAGAMIDSSTTASTSSTTGALIVAGGAGIAGDIYSGASINAGTTMTAGTSLTTPQIYGSSAASGNIKIDGTSNATKGYVLLNSAGGNVGIGTTNPNVVYSATASKVGILSAWSSGSPYNGVGLTVYGGDSSAGTTSVNGGSLAVSDSYWDGTQNRIDSFVFGAARSVAGAGNHEFQFLDESLTGGHKLMGLSNSALKFFTNGSNERMRIDSSGNVGIGTSAPTQARVVIANSSTSTPTNSISTNGLVVGGYAGTPTGNSAMGVYGSARGTMLIGGNYTSGITDIGDVKFLYAPLSTADENAASIASISAFNTATDSTSGGALRFSTRTPSGSNLERLRIDSSGNVGIGTTNPNASLAIRGTGMQTTYDTSVIVQKDVFQARINSASSTGTIVLTMPDSWDTNMSRISLKGYDYSNSTGPWEVVIGAYSYVDSSSWRN